MSGVEPAFVENLAPLHFEHRRIGERTAVHPENAVDPIVDD
jgi:hypothetical protein